MPEVILEAVGVVVSDLARAIEFYSQLGLDFPADGPYSEHGHAEAELAGGMRLMLDTEAEMRSFDPTWSRAGTGAIALGFKCETPEAVDELFRRAVAAGATPHKEPWDAFWGQRYAQLRDPDGNPFDLYAQLPRD